MIVSNERRISRLREELARVSSKLVSMQSENEVVKNNLEETKRDLDIARKDNVENVLKIEELLKENLQLVSELNQSNTYKEIDMKCKEFIAIDVIPEETVAQIDVNHKLQEILLRCK